MLPESSLPCVFCDIVAGQNTHYIVYEDAEYLAFLDKYPLNAGHTQFIPKRHMRWVWDMDKADIGIMFMKARRVVKALQKVCNTEWVIADTGGIGVPHAHVHLVPRFEDDGHGELPDPKILREIPDNEMEEIARKLRAEIERTPA